MAYLIRSYLVLICGLVVLGVHAQELEEEPVQQPAIVASVPNMNALYRGIDNPVEIAVPGVPCSGLTVTISDGKMRGSGCAYLVQPGKNNEVRMTATWSSARGEETAEALFRVRNMPAPQACFANSCQDHDSISVAAARAAQGVIARMLGLGFDLRFEVLHYRMRLFRDCGSIFNGVTEGPRRSGPMQEALEDAQAGDMIVICDIKVKGPDGREQAIAPLHLYLR